MADIQLRLGTDVLVVQGPMGTELIRQGFEADDCLPMLNVSEPEVIAELHRRYREAGADVGVTNTFLATSANLAAFGLAGAAEEVNTEGVRLAREAGFTHVLGCIGPCGIRVEQGSGASFVAVLDDAEKTADLVAANPLFCAAVEQYAEQASYLAAAGVEGYLLETFVSPDDCVAAVLGARRAADLPVLACMTFPAPRAAGTDAPGVDGAAATPDDASGALGDAEDPARAARLLASAGAAAVGCNCMPIGRTVDVVARMAVACGLPVVALPSAGEPAVDADGSPVWPAGPDDFSRASLDLLRAGARVVGSCCGATPACTGAIFATVGGTVFPQD